MTARPFLSSLKGWEATKETLHAYSKVVGAVPRAHGTFHPKWWHISLKVDPEGLVTDNIDLPGGGIFNLRMNLNAHQIQLKTSRGEGQKFSMTEGLTANQLAERLFDAVSVLGLSGEYAREKFESDDPREYNPSHAENYFANLVNVDRVFKRHKASISGDVGPVQLWPHGFDLAFEWFGTRFMEYEEHGEVTKYPSQINLGFSPGEPSHLEPYFYSNPWPFEEDELTAQKLPSGAKWFTENWQGSLLEYSDLVEDDQAEEKLLAYAKAVFEISSPTLMA